MRKHTHRKVRDPRGWIHARTQLTDEQYVDLSVVHHTSLSAMTSGHGTEQAWSNLACCLNVALILAERGQCEAAVPTIIAAQSELLTSRERAQRTGKWGFGGDGYRVVCAALDILDEQISRVSKGKIAEALNEVHRRVEVGEVFA